MAVLDALRRPLRSLRLSVTDRCNLRCQYCMPERDYTWLPRSDVLDFEEIAALVDVFADLGVDRLRLTGGEPLVRRELSRLVELLASKPAIVDVAMTTNGVLLAEKAGEMHAAGLSRVTVSLDTMRPDRFRDLTRFDAHGKVLAGIEEAVRVGLSPVKIDSVIMRGINEDEIADLIDFGRAVGAEVRFIEYMDVGGATRWSLDKVYSRREILETLTARYGAARPLLEGNSAPAERFRLPDGTVFGIIASTTAPFCRSCDRSRLTADGLWYLCLYARRGVDLRGPLRGGASREELRQRIDSIWSSRADRGAEERVGLADRRALVAPGALRNDPHLEMHTRGG